MIPSKIKIAYQEGEERAAADDLDELRRRHPGAKVRRSERYAPFKHIYLTIKNAEKPHKKGE